MKKTVLVLLALIMLLVVPCLFPTPVLAQHAAGIELLPRGELTQPTATAPLPKPTATVSLDPSSNCSGGTLDISVTTPISITSEFGRVTTSTGTVLFQNEEPIALGTSFTGGFGIPFSSVPPGTIVTVYGYLGQTPPSAANTAEFSITYRCDTGLVLQSCAGPYGPCLNGPDYPALDGRWFKLNAVVNGYTVDKANNNATKPHNFTVPFYMGFAMDTTTANTYYDVRVFTETAPGVWTNKVTTQKLPQIYSQSFFSDFGLQVFVNNATDYFVTYHTPYIKYVVDKTGALKSATYSGSGEVFTGSFNGNTLEYYGSVKISGSMVSVSQLPFTP